MILKLRIKETWSDKKGIYVAIDVDETNIKVRNYTNNFHVAGCILAVGNIADFIDTAVTVDFSDNSIATLDNIRNLNQLVNCTHLNLKNNELTSIDIEALPPNLKYLDVSGNQIHHINNINKTSIDELIIINNIPPNFAL